MTAAGPRPTTATGRNRARPLWPRAAAALLALLALAIVVPTPVGSAAPVQRITIGESNDQAQIAELLAVFGADPTGPYTTVTLAQTEALTGDVFDLTGVETAYSSTALACRPAGAGLDVETRNIEVVTPGLYAMALVTAGIDDAALVVAAPEDAPALGMTALAGVFASWDAAPCRGGAISPERRRLALEQIAVTAAIGQVDGSREEMARATRLVLATHQAVVTQDLTASAAIAAVIDREASAAELDLAPEQRTSLLDLMIRLGGPDLDWQTYAAGWTVADAGSDRIALRGLAAPEVAPAPVNAGGVGGAAARVASPAATLASLPAAPPPAAPRLTPTATVTSAAPVVAAAAPLRPIFGTVLGTSAGALTVRETGSEAPTTYDLRPRRQRAGATRRRHRALLRRRPVRRGLAAGRRRGGQGGRARCRLGGAGAGVTPAVSRFLVLAGGPGPDPRGRRRLHPPSRLSRSTRHWASRATGRDRWPTASVSPPVALPAHRRRGSVLANKGVALPATPPGVGSVTPDADQVRSGQVRG